MLDPKVRAELPSRAKSRRKDFAVAESQSPRDDSAENRAAVSQFRRSKFMSSFGKSKVGFLRMEDKENIDDTKMPTTEAKVSQSPRQEPAPRLRRGQTDMNLLHQAPGSPLVGKYLPPLQIDTPKRAELKSGK